MSSDGRMMATSIATSGTIFEPGPPMPLFRTRIAGTSNSFLHQYDVAPDGRFLINVTADAAAGAAITILLNWKPTS